MTEFERLLRDKIIERLALEDLDLSKLDSDSALFGSGLELDSIDALELEAMISEEWGITIHPSERTGSTFASLGALAKFIQENMYRDSKPK